MESYTLDDATTLNTIKNRLRDITKILDASNIVYLDTVETRQVRHEVSVLLSELEVHGLLPVDVIISQDDLPLPL